MSPAVFTPKRCQATALDFARARPRCALWLDMGLGKTVVALTLAREWLEAFECTRVLIVAPKRVAREQWPREFAKWTHTAGLDYVLIAGTPAERRAALRRDVSIAVISRDNLKWLVDEMGEGWNFDGLIYDESSGIKNHATDRFRLLRRVMGKFKRLVQLSGTPSPNSLEELWTQLYLIDGGKRLGRTITRYREAYFRQRWDGYGWNVVEECRPMIYSKIRDVCLSMSAEDYSDLPPAVVNDYAVELPGHARREYLRMEKESVLDLVEADEPITAANAGVLFGKLSQMASGSVYDADKRVHDLHAAKLDALEDIIEAANGEPILVAYAFKHERDRILARFAKMGATSIDDRNAVGRWNDGCIPLLLAHPASAGHGLNLQDGGRFALWYGLTASLELYQQFNARLQRTGQTKPVTITRLVATGTIDEDITGQILTGKDQGQRGLLAAVAARHGINFERRAA